MTKFRIPFTFTMLALGLTLCLALGVRAFAANAKDSRSPSTAPTPAAPAFRRQAEAEPQLYFPMILQAAIPLPITATPTSTPTLVATATSTPTATRITPTATPTPAAIATSTPTATRITPTATPTPTPTPSPVATATPTPTPTPTTGWTTLVREDFENAFPGPWTILDKSPDGKDYRWGKRNCKPAHGDFSGWALGGGMDGANLACGGEYADNTETWMIYGPFSLADATQAQVVFKRWSRTELNYDYFFWGASNNGVDFHGATISGDWTMWIDQIFNLNSVPDLGNLSGQPQVWIGFAFFSDLTNPAADGPYIDDIELRKLAGSGQAPPSFAAIPTRWLNDGKRTLNPARRRLPIHD